MCCELKFKCVVASDVVITLALSLVVESQTLVHVYRQHYEHGQDLLEYQALACDNIGAWLPRKIDDIELQIYKGDLGSPNTV